MRNLQPIVFVLCVLSAVTATSAQEFFPCCEDGARPGRACDSDSDCPGVCLGGARTGKICPASGCPDACVGGIDDGRRCSADAECRGRCQGGQRDGQHCSTGDPYPCPGGTCANPGTCSDLGQCVDGTCTELCRKGPIVDPVLAAQPAPEPCP